jgi:hypothetical protein
MDNQTLPAVVLLTVWMLAGRSGNKRLLKAASAALVVGMCVNAAVAIWSIDADLPWLRNFWSGYEGVTTAEKARTLGRFSGIFDHPAEAGEMSAMALLAAIWLFRNRPARLVAVSVAITVGGIVAASKSFLLLGLPIAGWQMLRMSAGRQRHLIGLACVGVAVVSAARLGVAADWAGGRMISNMFQPDGSGYGATDLYTAGRFGERSTLGPGIDAMLATSPWFGFGFGGVLLAYDNAWLEMLAVSGVFGVVTYTTVLVALATTWWRRRTQVDRAWSQFSGGLILVVAGASIGFPALTGNRVSTVAWVLVTLLLLCRPPERERVVLESRLSKEIEGPVSIGSSAAAAAAGPPATSSPIR